MRIAVAHWEERISPVFDVTDCLYLIDIEGGREVSRESRALVSRDPFLRAQEVLGLGVEVLVCGAISHVLETALIHLRVQVDGFICGEVNAVVESFLCNRPADNRFLMPGCRANRTRRRMRAGCGNRHRS